MIPNDILNYRVVRLLGSGGMGSVYLAVNTNIDQQVAIKVLRPELAKNPAFRAKLKQEAEMLCSLDHPNIVKFLNYVETADGVFLIMEYVKGMTLEDFINKKNGLIVESKAYPMVSELLDAFEYAHSKGIVHRDIKPSNIMIQEDGHVKIMDLGIAQIINDSNAASSAGSLGTPAYMSPEQVYGREVDTRSDIYSIGVLIQNMLTGKAPYDSTRLTMQEIKRRVVNDTMPRMKEYYPYISDNIQKVVDKATAKVPEARYQSCAEMKKAVKRAIAPDPVPKPLLYGGIAFVLALLVGGFLFWDYNRLKTEYYSDYAEVYGVPTGIGKLSGNEVAHRAASYRFEKSKGKVRRVSHVNSHGKIIPHTDSEDIDRIVDMTVSYAEGTGRADTEKFMNHSGKVIYVKDYDSKMKTCTFKLDDELGTEMTLNSQTELFQSVFDIDVEGKSKISKYILTFDDKGYLVKEEYAGFGNVREPNGQGIYGKKFVRDGKGRVLEEHYLGKDGSPKSTQFGLGVKKFEYDEKGNVCKIKYETIDGKPSSDGTNYPVATILYDKWGNRIKETYSDTEGNPMLRKDNNTAGFAYEYNDKGECVRMMYLGVDGNPTYNDGVAGAVKEYDGNGYVRKLTYVDAQGRPAVNSGENGIRVTSIEYLSDAKGNVLEYKLRDLNGNFIDTPGFAYKKCEYDSVGNQLREVYLDSEGNAYKPVQYGFAGIKCEYNPQGRLIKRAFIDESGELMESPQQKFSYMEREFDVRGNVTSVSFFNAKGEPTLSNENIASVKYEYDENGNEVSRRFYDTKGRPVAVAGLYCGLDMEYDSHGNMVSERYLNADGKPFIVRGKSGTVWEYDSLGNVVKERPLSLSGGLASGMLEIRKKYDTRGNQTECSFHNEAGKPEECDEGFHMVKYDYDSNNNVISQEYRGNDGRLKNLKGQNYAVVKREFDERGNKTSETYYTQSGARGNDSGKVHKYYSQYDKISNKKSHEISFGVDGKPVAANNYAPEARAEYDRRGNMVRIACYDGYGKKSTGNHGWHESRMEYDDAGLMTSKSYFSIEGKPVVDKDEKVHKIVYTYNPMRLRDSETYYGADGRRCNGANGCSRIKIKYDENNRRKELSYWGANDQKTSNSAGTHREVYTYKNGLENKCVFYDVNNRKIGEMELVNNKWKAKSGMVAAGSYWMAVWMEASRMCPVKVNDAVAITAIKVNPNSVIMELKTDLDFDPAEITAHGHEIVKNFREMTKTPSDVAIKVVIRDKDNNVVVSL